MSGKIWNSDWYMYLHVNISLVQQAVAKLYEKDDF